MKCTIFALVLATLFAGQVGQASAQFINLTDNSGVGNGSTIAAQDVATTKGVSDTFSLTSNLSVTGLELDLFVNAASGGISSLVVTITENPAVGPSTTILGPTTVPITNSTTTYSDITVDGKNDTYTFNHSIIDFNNLISLTTTLDSGPPPTYTLTISSAITNTAINPDTGKPYNVLWEDNTSPLSIDGGGNQISTAPSDSNTGNGMSFALDGTPFGNDLSSTPEPGSVAMMGMAAFSFAGYFGMRRRKLAAMA
jgi:hypothetical protein